MNTYLKFIVIAALFLTTGAVSVFGQSENSSPSTTDQKTVAETANKSEKVIQSDSSISKSSESSIEASQSIASDTADVESESSTQASDQSYPTAVSSEETNSSPAGAEAGTESAQSTSRPAPTVNEAAPAPETQNTEKNEPAAIQADQMRINGQLISYSNAGRATGQAIIDGNPSQAATWGGAAAQSGNDGENTHFIGHNPGIFNLLFSLEPGEVIDVADSGNNVTSYTVSQIVTVDDSGMAEDGSDYWDQITGNGGGERITLQTCIDDDMNLIVFANK